MVRQYSSLIISIQKFPPVRSQPTTAGTLKLLERRIERKLDHCCDSARVSARNKKDTAELDFFEIIFGKPQSESSSGNETTGH